MIQVRELSKYYGERKAISELNFSIQKGEVVGLLGPNGAGKSTTMKIMTGCMAPSLGQVIIDGVDIFEQPKLVKSKIGYLPETPPLYAEMRVREYLEFTADLKGVVKKNKKPFVDEVITKMQLKEVENRWISNLSKGYCQRVGVAQAIVSKPEVIILDEPTVGLDPEQVAEMRKLLKELKSNHTVIISSHILTEIQSTCDKVIVLDQGRMVAEDKIENLSKLGASVNFKVKYPDKLPLAELNSLGQLTLSAGVGALIVKRISDETLTDLSNLIASSGAGIIDFRSGDKGLEDSFLSLIKRQRESVGE